MEQPLYKLDVFEGPMDLLLHLITKHKLDIYDIPIIELVDQYTAYVRNMQDSDMEVASEFLEMAARLVYIKTVSLLPVYEEAEELKKELTGELLEYRDCKILAKKLSEQTEGFDLLTRAPENIDPDMTYRRLHETSELISAYIAAAGKKLRRLPPPLDSFKNIVTKKIVSVASKIESIKACLRSVKKRRLSDIFKSAESRSDLVAAFLAVLELAKSKEVYISGDGDNTEIELLEGNEPI
ncbi:MAG: segregation/condensation protein A [Oscillospiraceae bacterium]|nr:segregation/condensation protein A [Oscillospiraceae bacterium]